MSAYVNDGSDEEWGEWGNATPNTIQKTDDKDDDSDWGEKPTKPSFKSNSFKTDKGYNDRDKPNERGGWNNDRNKRNFDDNRSNGHFKSNRNRSGSDDRKPRFRRNDDNNNNDRDSKSGWKPRDNSGDRKFNRPNRFMNNSGDDNDSSNQRRVYRADGDRDDTRFREFKPRGNRRDDDGDSGWKARDNDYRRSNFRRDNGSDNERGYGKSNRFNKKDSDDECGTDNQYMPRRFNNRDNDNGRDNHQSKPKRFNKNDSDDDWGENQRRSNKFTNKGSDDDFGERKFRSRDDRDELSNNFNKKSDLNGDRNEEEEPNKRVTYVPDDNEEDYFLHVNSGINFDNYDKIPVEVTGDDVPPSIVKFSDLDLPEFVKVNIESLKYKTLTPIQKYAIPIINKNRDLMGCAQTGSGKTFAFLLPIIMNIANECEDAAETKTVFPKALIMAPTRELCRQIYTAASQLCKGSKIKCGYVYGGIEMNKSRRNLMEGGCDILVATPGRLIHFLELVWISLKYLKFLVLDEADRMLDADGFYESVNKIYEEANCFGDDRQVQISMFSATFPNEIQNLAKNLLKNYLFLAVGAVGSANCDVHQEIIQTEQKDKVNKAVDYIKSMPDQKTLIFVESKRMADFFGIKLGYLGYKATTIHGDRDQQQREMALNDFKSGRVTYMVATNVAARGLDIPKVDTVINIDMPAEIDTYVHRIGRTGRCGNVGRAVSFFDEEKDIGLVHGLVAKLGEANQDCPEWLKLIAGSAPQSTGNYRRQYQSRDNRSDVKVNKFVDKPNDDEDFMKGSNTNYETPNTFTNNDDEWLTD